MDDFENPPIHTKQSLQSARSDEMKRKEDERIKKEENYGLNWARRVVYPAVVQSATEGRTEVDVKVPNDKSFFTQVSYDYAFTKIRYWFPDCEIHAPDFKALEDSVKRSIRVSWV